MEYITKLNVEKTEQILRLVKWEKISPHIESVIGSLHISVSIFVVFFSIASVAPS